MADGDVGERLFSEDFDVENDLPKFLDSVLDKVEYIFQSINVHQKPQNLMLKLLIKASV